MNLKEAQKMPQGKEICWGDTKMSHKMMYQWGSTNRKQCLKIKRALFENHPKIVSFIVILHFNNLFLCYKRYFSRIMRLFVQQPNTVILAQKPFFNRGKSNENAAYLTFTLKPSVFCSCFFGTLINYFQLLSTKKSGFHFFCGCFLESSRVWLYFLVFYSSLPLILNESRSYYKSPKGNKKKGPLKIRRKKPTIDHPQKVLYYK